MIESMPNLNGPTRSRQHRRQDEPRGVDRSRRRPAPRWRIVLIAVMVALSVASAGDPQPVLAASRQGGYSAVLQVVPVRAMAEVCAGESVGINVTAVLRGESVDQNEIPDIDVVAVTVTGSVGSPDIGSLVPPSTSTSMSADRPGSGAFTFTAKKAGATEVSFSGTQQQGWLGGLVEYDTAFGGPVTLVVTVMNCQYEVSAFSDWTWAHINYAVTIDKAKLTATDASSGRFTGSATAHWVIDDNPTAFGCSPPSVLTLTSEVELAGQLNETGQLTVQITYQVAEGELTMNHYLSDCRSTHSTGTESVTPSTLIFSVPASGGSAVENQTLDDTYLSQRTPGSALLFVYPVSQP